ncbi:MAG: energy-coupled thiamine transporter ThiT, partial [Clostridia bacterium]
MLFHQDVPFAEFAIFDKVATIAIYITIALILAVTVIGFLVKKKNQQLMPQFAWTATGLAFGYAIGLISVLLFLKLDEYIAVGYIDKLTFWPVLSLLILAIALAIVGLVISIFKKERFKLFTKIALGILSVGLAIILITNAITMYKGAEVAVGSEVQLYVYTALIAAAIAVIALACGKKSDADNTRSIVYASICIAMSFALSYLRLFELPSGGSITFASLLPLMIYSYKFGIRKGVQAGIIYGVLQFIQAPWFYHPVQFLLD